MMSSADSTFMSHLRQVDRITNLHTCFPLWVAGTCFVCLVVVSSVILLGDTRDLVLTCELIVFAVALWLAWRFLRRANDWTKRQDFFNPAVAFVAAYLIWFALGSANVFDLPDSISGGAFTPIPSSQWGFYLLGLAGYCVGLWLGGIPLSVNPEKLEVRNNWDPTRFGRAIFLLAIVMLVSGAAQVYQFGIPGLSRMAGEERLALRGIPHFLFTSCAFTLLIVIPAHIWTRMLSRRAKVVGFTFVFLIAIALPLLQGGRSDLVVSMLTVFISFHYVKKRKTLGSLVVLGSCVLVLLSAMGYVRDYSLTSGEGMDWLTMLRLPAWSVPILYALLYVRYTVATFRDVTTIIPHHVPYQLGALTFGAFKTFLPGHHDMSDVFFKNMLGSDFVGGGQPATLLGPLYGDFGVAGILLGMIAFGLIAASAYRRMVQNRSLINVIIYAWILQTGFMGLFGSLFTYISTLSLPVMWLTLDWLVKKPSMRNKLMVATQS